MCLCVGGACPLHALIAKYVPILWACFVLKRRESVRVDQCRDKQSPSLMAAGPSVVLSLRSLISLQRTAAVTAPNCTQCGG